MRRGRVQHVIPMAIALALALWHTTVRAEDNTRFSLGLKYWGASTQWSARKASPESFEFAHIPGVAVAAARRKFYAGVGFSSANVISSNGALKTESTLVDGDLYAGYFIWDRVALFADLKQFNARASIVTRSGRQAGSASLAETGLGGGVAAFQNAPRGVTVYENIGVSRGIARQVSKDAQGSALKSERYGVNRWVMEAGASWAPPQSWWRVSAGYKWRRTWSSAEFAVEYGVILGVVYTFL